MDLAEDFHLESDWVRGFHLGSVRVRVTEMVLDWALPTVLVSVMDLVKSSGLVMDWVKVTMTDSEMDLGSHSDWVRV